VLALFLNLAQGILPGTTAPTAQAHNLQTRMVSMFMDPASQAILDARMAAPGWTPPDPLLQAGDEIGLIIKVVPRDGTTTGVGGHIDFYVPNGVTVLDTAYVVPDGAGGFVKVAMKGQSPIAIGDGPIGAKSTAQLVGLGTNYTNFIGVTEAPVSATGLHRGTIAGLYGDTGIFYATDPDAAYGSWQKYTGDWNNANAYANKCGSLAFTAANGKTLINNSGDTVVPCNKWDAEQLMAWGVKGGSFGQSAPIVDYGDGRGNAPWGFAAGAAGPQSGYAWHFDWDEWQASGKTAADMRNAMGNDEIGPWQRIQYLGSRISKDQAGLDSTVLGYANIDGGSVGFALSPSTPLTPTVSQTDGASPKAIRWAVGQLTANRPEYAWVKIKVNSVAEIVNPSGCPIFHSDTFGGDAGGTNNGKDHLWRYYEPTEATWNGCLAAQKPATREIVKVGDTYQYKIKVYNFQNFTLSSVVVRDTIPGGVTFISAVPAANSGPNPLVWNVGTLLPGQKFEATVTVQAKSTGFLDNCLEVASNQLPTQTVCDSTTSGGYPYLVPSKTAASSTVTPGGSVTYTLLVKNVGTASSASPVVLDEYLPAGFTYQSLGAVTVNGAAVSGTTVNASNANQPSFSVPVAIQAGKELRLTFTAKAPANVTPGAYCNTYRVVDNGIPITTGSEACVTVGGGNGKIGDTVFRDWNGNGSQDAGEEGLPGVTVTLTRPDSSTVTTVTDANGGYLFASLAPGSYTVSVPAPGTGGVPAGYVLTADPNGAPYALSFVKNLGTDEVYLGADFGYQPRGTGSIGDQVFDDKDISGTFNAGDAGIGNVTVRLYEDGNGNGVIDAGDALVAVVTSTVGSGVYGFTNLATGFKYIVDVDQTDTDLSTYFGGGVFAATTADPHNVGTLTGAYTAADFGFHKDVPPGTFSIGDQVFIDASNNGTYEAGTDTPLPNVGLTLYQDLGTVGVLDAADVAIGTVTTSITGTYTFGNLPAGNYLVDVNQADPDIPSGYALRSGTSDPWPVTLGPSRSDVDFPFVYVPPPASPLTKAVDKTNANAGDTLTYNLTTSYTGSSLLTNVTVTDTVPAGTTYVADSDTPEATVTPADDNTASLLTWNLGSNAAGVPGSSTGGGGGNGGMAVFYSGTSTATRYNPWNGSAFTTSSNTAGTVSIAYGLQGAASPTRNEKLFIGLNASGALKGEIWNGSAWTLIPSTSLGSPGTTDDQWSYDAAYEQQSGDALIVFQDASNTLQYATWNGSAWTAKAAVSNYATLSGGSAPARVVLASKPGSNEIALVVNAGANAAIAFIWNGSSWGSGTVLRSGVTPSFSTSVAYESLSGNIMVVYGKGNGDTNAYYWIWNGSAWSAEASIASPGAINNVTFTMLASDPQSDRIILGATTSWSFTAAHTWMNVWNGNAWGTAVMGSTTANSYPATPGAYGWAYYPSVDVAFEGASGEALAVFNDISQPNIYYKTWSPSTGWLAAPAVALNIGAKANVITLSPAPNSDRIMVAAQNINDDLTYTLWPGSAPFGAGTVLETATGGSPSSQPFLFLWDQNPGPNLGNVMSAAPTLVTAGSTITVTMALTSSTSIANVSPNTLVITGTNGVSATLATGPTPASATISSSPTTFTWTYQATAGTNIGQLTFGGDADDGGSNTWPWAQSNSVIVHPPLTFQVTVNNPATANPVTNTAYIKDASVIPLSPSNTVQTTIGASIGDRVWADLDGGADQDTGEPGIRGVEVCASPLAGGTGGGCATTDSQGIYHIYGLTNGVQYTVTMTPATIPTNYQPTTATTLVRTATTAGVTDADFGLRPPGTASIGDTVCLDTGENGCDAGDAGLPNITLRLYKDLTNNGLTGDDILMGTKTTDANGVYTFTGLYGGDYLVQVDTSSVVTTSFGITSTLALAMDLVSGTHPHDVALSNGQAYTTADFGYNWGGSIGDYVWWDNNINRLQDESPATPITNAAVLLYYDANNNGRLDALGGDVQVGFDMTDAAGLYLFDNLPPGRYLVDVYEDSITTNGVRDIVPTTLDVIVKNLAPNEDYLAADFGYYVGAKVEGNVFWDEDHNGVLDGAEQDAPHLLENVTVNIACLGPDGVAGGGDDYSASMDTGTTGLPDGHFAFVVPPGPCTLTYDQPDIPAQYTERTTPVSYAFTAVGGEDWHPSFDFGVDHGGVIGDTVYADANGNQAQDPDEPGLAGVTLRLYDSTGATLLAVTTTDSEGHYRFTGLADAAYRVSPNPATIPVSYTLTTANDPYVATLSAGNGHQDLAADFGYQGGSGGATALRTIRGAVWYDTNGDGIFSSEAYIPTVTVTADCGAGGIFTTRTRLSGAGGNWSIAGIPDGSTCTVTVLTATLPSAAYVQTGDPDQPGVPCSTCDSRTTTPISVNGADVTGINFGYRERFGSISGTVCEAYDLTGLCLGAAPPLTPVTVTLRYAGPDGFIGTADDITQTLATNSSGVYTFTNLLPGAYQVLADTLAGYSSISDRDGFNPDNIAVSLAVAQNATQQDFQDGRPPSLAIQKQVVAPLGGVAFVGETITYALRITNTGSVSLTAASLADVYDATKLTPTGWDVTPNGQTTGVLTWTTNLAPWLPLAPGGGFTFTVRFRAEAISDPNSITNTATITAVDTIGRTAGPAQAQADVRTLAPALIGDRVWWDINGDGVQDGDEPGIPGVTVVLTNSLGVTTTATTNAAGVYSFTQLAAGGYTVAPAGATLPNWTPTQPAPPTTSTVVAAGQTRLDADFGFTIASGTAIEKRRNMVDPVRPGEQISFTILITNTGATWINSLQLTDAFSETYLTYGFGGAFAVPDSDDHVNDGLLNWTDVLSVARGGPGPLAPGASMAVTVTFTGRSDTHAVGPNGTRNLATVQDGRFDPDGPSGSITPRAVPSVPPASDDAYVKVFVPTGLTLVDFTAAAGRAGVTLTWRTANEAQLLGFNVYRRVSNGPLQLVNGEIIPAEHAGSNQGDRYTFSDQPAAGAYAYLLELIHLDGSRTRTNLIAVRVGP
jgi:uncharacterized repeat protein (TIGR01451 family)